MDPQSYWRRASRNRTRRQLLAGTLGLAGASFLAACGAKNNPTSSSGKPATATAGQSAPPGPPAKLSVSIGAADPAYLTVYLAKSAGIFERNGLLVDIQTIAGPQALQALVAKGIQIATAGAGETLSAAVAGVDLSIVASPNPTFAGYIYAGPNIKQPSDLKGKKAGITSPGGTYDTLMRASLPKIGLEPDKDVTFIATGSIPNVLAALLTDAIQVAPSAVGPNSIKLEAAGFHSVFDPAGIPFAAASTVMPKAWIAANRDVAQRYVDSIIQSIARQKKDKAGTIAAMKDFLGVSDQQVLEVTYDYFSQDKITLSQPYPKAELFAIQLEQIAKQNAAAKGFDISKVIDPSLVDSAVKRGLDKG
jgi:NitT/TauT family transport system substrate-binding protein